jgi:ferrous iron transport protein B
MQKNINIALIGNPNSGKTTLFNNLTNFNQKTANYSGVTVDKKIGIKKYNDSLFHLVDLPGIYSLSPVSEEEHITKNYILNKKIDLIVNVVDSSNLKKSLFLTTQLLELNIKVVLVLNMRDIIEKNDLKIDIEKLKNKLNVEVVFLSAHKKNNIDELLQTILQTHENKKNHFANKFSHVEKNVYNNQKNESVIKKRHDFINSFISEILKVKKQNKKSLLNRLDDLLTNKFLGPVIFLFIMYMVFYITFNLSTYPVKFLENVFSYINESIKNIWPENFYSNLRSLFLDGILSGVCNVIMFLPNIMLLFFSISVLEESGYMTRAVFVLDKLMHKIGLHGKSIIPLIIGFGCTVPAILSTRTLESKKDRIITIFALPLISCSAKLVVFSMIIPAFFEKKYQALVLLSLYLIGIAVAIFLIKILNLTVFKTKKTSFIIEMPPLQFFSLKSVFIQIMDRSKDYIKNAGTLILAFSILIWALTSFPKSEIKENKLSNTYVEKIGKKLDPIFKPLGFDWRVNTSLISSFVAKEVFVAQMSVIYSTNDKVSDNQTLQEKLKKDYSSMQAFSIMLFILLSSPCMATIAATRKELNSYKLAFLQLFSLTILAYLLTFSFYKIATLIGGS